MNRIDPHAITRKRPKITWTRKRKVWTAEVSATGKIAFTFPKGAHPTVEEIDQYERVLADAGALIDCYIVKALELWRDEVAKENERPSPAYVTPKPREVIR